MRLIYYLDELINSSEDCDSAMLSMEELLKIKEALAVLYSELEVSQIAVQELLSNKRNFENALHNIIKIGNSKNLDGGHARQMYQIARDTINK
jgi:hypothetical protein